MLLDGQGNRWNAKPDQLRRTSEGQDVKNAAPEEPCRILYRMDIVLARLVYAESL